MSAPLLAYRHIFGLKPDVKNNVHYLDDQTVLYPAGHNVIVYSGESKTQRFIHGTDFSQTMGRAEICALAVSPNHRFVAVSERGAERGQISVFDIGSLKKRKTLATGECLSREFVSLCFSPNGEYLLSLSAAPDFCLINWEWKKSRHTQLSKIECKNQAVTQCSFCPSDAKMVCVTGLNTLQYFKIEASAATATATGAAGSAPIAGAQFKPLETTMYNEVPEDYTCHVWTTQKKMIVGTSRGRLLFIENTLFRTALRTAPANDRRIECIEATAKGFVIGCEDGTVRVFERDEKEFYKSVRTFNVDGAPRVRSMSISPSDEHLCISTDTSQLYVMRAFDSDAPTVDSSQKFELLHVKNHSGAITGLDVCIRKPIVVTCGEDRTVRIWNYLTKTVELTKTFPDIPCSVALHPSGLHLLVGFADRLKFMNILMDDIRPVKELPIKDCREVRFSNGGHLFAAAQSGQIMLFNTYTCELYTPAFKQHSARVRSLYFSLDDSLLISSGDDGSVYGKKLHQLTKSHNYSEKAIKFPAALCDEAGMIYAAGDDRILKLIHGKNVIKIVNCEVVLTALSISRQSKEQKMMFAGTVSGVVRSFKFPITGEIKDYTCHCKPVSRMRISEDDAFLFTVADDGCLAMFDVKENAAAVGGGRAVAVARRDRPDVTGYSEEVLVTKSDLEEKNGKMMELRTNLEELSKRYEMQVKLNDLTQTDKLKALHDKYHLQLNHNKSRVDMLKDERAALKLEFEQKRKALQQLHMQNLQGKDMEFTTQVINEHQKGTKLDDEIKLSQQQFDAQKEARERKHKLDLAAVKESYEQDVDVLKDRCTVIAADCARLDRQIAEVRSQIEDDADAEIEAFKAKNEERLQEQKQITLGLKGENTHMKKKFTSLEKNIIDQNENLRAFKDKEVELADRKKELDDMIDQHKTDIDEHDNRIGKHETDIYDLKKENQELEKYKFVLDYQIKHYKTQIEPKDKAIQKMKEKVAEMDKKLSKEHKKNGELNDLKKQLEASLKAKQKEIRLQRQRCRWRRMELDALANDLHAVVQHIQDPLVLRTRTIELYRKHVTEQIQAAEVDPDVAKEYRRQRQFLEKSVDALKRKLTRDMKARKNENMRIMQENVALIKEINALRKEIKNMRQVQRHKDLHAVEYSKDDQFDEKDAQRIIDRQREQISTLRQQIEDAHKRLVQARPVSRERLPPIAGAGGTADEYSNAAAGTTTVS